MNRPRLPVPAAPGREGEAGFTLVELLVALSLLSLIAVFIGEGIFAVRSAASLTGRIDGASETGAVRDHLRRTLGEAVPGTAIGLNVSLEGRPSALEVFAPADPLLESGGLNRVALALEPGGRGGMDLVERRETARPEPLPDPARTVLLRGVRGLSLAYAGPVTDGAPNWQASWIGQAEMPALVRLEVEFAAGDPRRFPPLLVHPAAVTAEDGERSGPSGAPPPSATRGR